MKRVRLDTPFPLFLLGAIISGIFFYALSTQMSQKSYLYDFFFKFWPIQVFNTWLFVISIIFVFSRYINFKDEEEVLQKMRMPEFTISYAEARELIKDIPFQFTKTLCFRRASEILKGFLYREDVIRLNEELSRRDMGHIERGHLILDSLRQIIPVVGFLGTVIGLSLGMAKFPQIASSVENIDDLRDILKDFAGNLSVAFDTTLLALTYTVIVIFITALLRGAEEAHVSEVDEKARELISKLKSIAEDNERRTTDNTDDLNMIADILRDNGKDMLRKLDEIKDTFNGPS